MKKYKDPEYRKIAVPFSVSIKTIGDFETESEKLGYSKSQIANALFVYFVKNTQNKRFIEEVIKLI